MNQLLSIGWKSLSKSSRKTNALKKYFGFMLLMLCSAGMGLFLQFTLPQIDPFSSVIDSSIWVILCYTLTGFLLFHLLSFKLTYLLLDSAKTYFKTFLKETSWWGFLVFLGVYFLLLYGFLLCLMLWL